MKYGSLDATRRKAQHWNRIFDRFVRLLDGLQKKQESELTGSILFLMQRALGGLELSDQANLEPAMPIDLETDRFEGMDYMDAMDVACSPVSESQEIASDELQVLMVLGSHLLKAESDGRFVDVSFTDQEIADEYNHLSAQGSAAPGGSKLLPEEVAVAWRSLLENAAKRSDPLKRLRLEVTILRVIRALYSMAIGLRRSPDLEEEEVAASGPWLSFTVGDAFLTAGQS